MKLIRFPVYDNSEADNGKLSERASAGATVIKVPSAATLFSANGFLIIDDEIVKVLSISVNDITLTAATTTTHENGSTVTELAYDKYDILKSSTVDGSYEAISGSEKSIPPLDEYEIVYKHRDSTDAFYKIRWKNSHSSAELIDSALVSSNIFFNLYATIGDARTQSIIDLSEFSDQEVLNFIELATTQIIDFLNYDLYYQGVQGERVETITDQSDHTILLTKVRPVVELMKDEFDRYIDVLLEFRAGQVARISGERVQIVDKGVRMFAVNSTGVINFDRLSNMGAAPIDLSIGAPLGYGGLDSSPFINEEPIATLSYWGGLRNIPYEIKQALFYYLKNNKDIQSADNALASGIKRRKIQKREIEYFGGKDASATATSSTKIEAEAEKILSKYKQIL